MTEPTDSEILDAADDFRSQYMHGGITFDEFDSIGFARAVLAKFGTPPAVAGQLADEQIAEIGVACGLGCKVADEGYPCDMLWFDGNPTPFARAIESEVRKQDEALIQQLVNALENHAGNYKLTQLECQPHNAAVAAGRARLKGKP